jgi:hypothetical protein
MEWGCTSEFEERCASRRQEHPGCQNVMIIDVGTHDSKVLDSSMEEFVKVSHAHLCKPVSTHDRYFYGPKGEDEEEYFVRFQKYIETRFRPILRYITREGAGTVVYGGENAPHIHTEALPNRHGGSLYVRQLGWEKNKLELERSKIKLETSRLELERSKIELEIRRMDLALAKTN